MQNQNISRVYSLIALNDEEVANLTSSKKILLKGIAASVVLELYLNDTLQRKNHHLIYDKKKDNHVLTTPQQTVLNCLSGKKKRMKMSLEEWLEKVKKLSRKQLKKIEESFVSCLKQDHLLEAVPSLLSCDLEFETAGITVNVYQSEADHYQKIVERFRSNILDEGPVTNESVIMLWLGKESGFSQAIFADKEWDRVAERFQKLPEYHDLAKRLFPLTIHRFIENLINRFLKRKKSIMTTQAGAGVNFIIPVLERSEAVFIDTKNFFPKKEERLRCVTDRLDKYNIPYQVIRGGDVPILKIHNVVYHAVPYTKQYRIPVHGVQLRRHPVSSA